MVGALPLPYTAQQGVVIVPIGNVNRKSSTKTRKATVN